MALITKIEQEFKVYCTGITVGVKIASIAPSIAFIEKNYIKKELGKEQYDELVEAYEASIANSPTPMSDELEALWKAVAAALCPLAAWHFAGANAAEMSDAGQRDRTAEDGTGVRMWVSNLQRDTWFEQGMVELDNLLAFLDENKADYPLWVDGSGYAGLKSNILQTTEQFNDAVAANDSRRFFKMLKPDIKQVEFLTIRPAISAAFYTRLIDGLKAGDLTTEEQAVVDLLRPAIAKMAISISKSPIQYGTDGIYQISVSAADGGTKNKNLPDDSVLADRKREEYYSGKQYLNAALDYLNKNATDSVLSEYYESELYEDPTANDYGDLKDNNNELQTIFGL